MAPGNPRQWSKWLPALLGALLLAAPNMPRTAAAPLGQQQRPQAAPARAAQFSQLAEVTPANVDTLMPLVSRSLAMMVHESKFDASAAAGLALQRFVEERTGKLDGRRHLQGLNGVVSYLIGSGAAELSAWDPVDRHVVWSVHESPPISGGTLVTAGGLVLYGTSDGWFKALDARTGHTLWRHRVDGRKLDEPMSYRGADGHQYIAVRSLPRGPLDGSATVLLFALAH